MSLFQMLSLFMYFLVLCLISNLVFWISPNQYNGKECKSENILHTTKILCTHERDNFSRMDRILNYRILCVLRTQNWHTRSWSEQNNFVAYLPYQWRSLFSILICFFICSFSTLLYFKPYIIWAIPCSIAEDLFHCLKSRILFARVALLTLLISCWELVDQVYHLDTFF